MDENLDEGQQQVVGPRLVLHAVAPCPEEQILIKFSF